MQRAALDDDGAGLGERVARAGGREEGEGAADCRRAERGSTVTVTVMSRVEGGEKIAERGKTQLRMLWSREDVRCCQCQ